MLAFLSSDQGKGRDEEEHLDATTFSLVKGLIPGVRNKHSKSYDSWKLGCCREDRQSQLKLISRLGNANSRPQILHG